MILTVDELREHVNSGLGDDALQRLLDAAEEAIVARAGTSGARTQLFGGGYRFLSLYRPAASITSITETDWPNDTTPTTLAANDYLVRPGDYLIERLSGGTNSRSTWHRRVAVVYVPVDDDATRISVQIDLCKLALDYSPGLSSERIGEWEQSFANNSAWNIAEERDAILSRLNAEPGMVVA